MGERSQTQHLHILFYVLFMMPSFLTLEQTLLISTHHHNNTFAVMDPTNKLATS